jgi:hypothetical protein
MRTKILALLLCFAIVQVSSAVAKDDGGYNVMYDGGSLPGLKAGKKLRMYIDAKEIRIMDGKELVTTLVPSTIQDISYDQDVHRRIGAAIGLAVVSLTPRLPELHIGPLWLGSITNEPAAPKQCIAIRAAQDCRSRRKYQCRMEIFTVGDVKRSVPRLKTVRRV